MTSNRTVHCDYCSGPATFCPRSDHVYRFDYGPIWQCKPCQAWVGCHPDGTPLGRLANATLRRAKIAAHAAFDPLIAGKMRRDNCSKQLARKAAYKWLGKQLGLPPAQCHIGMMDEQRCAEVVEVCQIVRQAAAHQAAVRQAKAARGAG